MVSYFTYRGHKSTEYGLIISSSSTVAGAEEVLETVTIPGRSGVLTMDNQRREEIEVGYNVWGKAGRNEEKAAYMRRLKGWLLVGQGDYYQLSDIYDPDYFWMARYAGPVDLEEDFRGFVTLELRFMAYPFKYSLIGSRPVALGGSSFAPGTAYTLTNPEAYNSEPYFKLTGNGDMTLTVNGQAWTIENVQGYVEMDSRLMDTFVGNTSWNNKKTGDGYPVFVPGENTITVSGNVSAVEIVPRWCAL